MLSAAHRWTGLLSRKLRPRIPAPSRAAAQRRCRFSGPLRAVFAPTRGVAAGAAQRRRLSQQATKPLYLHIGPSGDCWTGPSIFAAKHLQSDYVRSILLPDSVAIESLLEAIQEDTPLQHLIYDEQRIPPSLLEKATKRDTEDSDT